MKKTIIICSILVAIGVLLGVGNLLVQRRATKAMNDGLHKSVKQVLKNPENLTVTNAPIQFGAETSRIPEVQITGKALVTNQDVTVQSAKVVIRDIEVGTKTRDLKKVGSGTFEVVFSAADLTSYFRNQKSQRIGGLTVAPETVAVTLSAQDGVGLSGEGTPPGRSDRVPFTMHGTLTAEPSTGTGRFTVTSLTVGGMAITDLDQAAQAVPVANLLPAKLQGQVTEIVTGDGVITFRGTLDGRAFLGKGQ